uniref:Dynein light chain n=1 Tax=Ascaris lumbricoides TaxID=6252 RepID=A0A0M3I877_ASCLU
MMPIAQHLMTRFEQKYGAPWHCVVSDGQLGFYVRYDPAGHIYFAVGSTIIFLFRNQNP